MATQRTLAFHVSKEGDANILLFGSKTNPTEGYLGTLTEDQSLPRGKQGPLSCGAPQRPPPLLEKPQALEERGASPRPAEAAPEDVKESIQTVSCCLPPQLHPLLLRKGHTVFQNLQPTMAAALPRVSSGSSGLLCSHGRARAPAASARLRRQVRGYNLTPVGFCPLRHTPRKTVLEVSKSGGHTTWRGGQTGTPSVGLSPGSLAHPSRAPSSRPPSYPVPLACGTGITHPCKECSVVMPPRGDGARQAEALCPGSWPGAMCGTGHGV